MLFFQLHADTAVLETCAFLDKPVHIAALSRDAIQQIYRLVLRIGCLEGVLHLQGLRIIFHFRIELCSHKFIDRPVIRRHLLADVFGKQRQSAIRIIVLFSDRPFGKRGEVQILRPFQRLYFDADAFILALYAAHARGHDGQAPGGLLLDPVIIKLPRVEVKIHIRIDGYDRQKLRQLFLEPDPLLHIAQDVPRLCMSHILGPVKQLLIGALQRILISRRILILEKQRGIKADVEIIAIVQDVQRIKPVLIVRFHDIFEVQRNGRQLNAHLGKVGREIRFKGPLHIRAGLIAEHQLQLPQLTVHFLAAHAVCQRIKRFSALVERPARFIEKARRFLRVQLISAQAVQVELFPGRKVFLVDRYFLRRSFLGIFNRVRQQSGSRVKHPLSEPIQALHFQAISADVVAEECLTIKAVCDRLPDLLLLNRQTVRIKIEIRQTDARIRAVPILRLVNDQTQAFGDRGTVRYLIEQRILAFPQLLDHAPIVRDRVRQLGDPRLLALFIALVIGVDLEFRGLAVIGKNAIGAGDRVRMRHKAAAGGEYGFAEQIGGKRRRFRGELRVGDKGPAPLIGHRAAGSDSSDRVGIERQARKLIKIRQ